MSLLPPLPLESFPPEASEFPRKLGEFLKSAPLYKPLRFESVWGDPDQFGGLAVPLPAEIDLYCTTCNQIQRFKTGHKIAASGQGVVYFCKNCDKSPMVFFLWVEKAAEMAEVMKVGQYPRLSDSRLSP